jgi:DNA-binding NarL/FixJ family response regulator
MVDGIKKIKLYITNNLNNELNLNFNEELPKNNFIILSSRKIEVLKYITEGKRNIIFTEYLKINQKIVNISKNSIMCKLKASNMFDLYIQAENLNLA